MLIFQCIIVLQSQCIDFKSSFSKAGIPIGLTVSIENTRDFNSDGSQCDVVPGLNKSVYCQSGDARPWCEKLLFFLLYQCFVVSKEYPCLLMSKTVI